MPLVMKITDDYYNFGKEIAALRRVSKLSQDTPKVFSYGLVVHKDTIKAWVIMPRYGTNLQDYFEKVDHNLSKSSIYKIGKSLLKMLETTHEAGYVYNDLKLDNIMVGKDLSSLHLIDFGFASKYRDRKTEQHFSKSNLDRFRGNIVFSSLNQLEFNLTSRKDDLVSLCYVLVHLLNRVDLKKKTSSLATITPQETFN